MDWQQIREQYPHRWLVMEALGAYTEDEYLVVNELVFVADFRDDGSGAMKYANKISKEQPKRTYIFYHTANDFIQIEVIRQFTPRWFVDEEMEN